MGTRTTLAGAFVLLVTAAVAAQGGAASPALTVKVFRVPAGGVTDLAAGPGGMWFSALGQTQVGRITPAGKIKRWAVPGLLGADNSAAGNNIVLGPDKNVWITGGTAAATVVARVRPNGAGRVFDLGMPNAPGRDAIAALGTRKGGPLFYGIWWNKAGRVTPTGSVLAKVEAGFPPTAAAIGWAADRSDAMWFVFGRGYGRIAGTNVRFWEPLPPHEFVDIALGADGNLWLADKNSAAGRGVARVTPAGAYRQFAVQGRPRSIVAGPDGNLWVATDFGGAIVRVTPKGAVKRFPLPVASTSAIASGFGKLWVVTGNAGEITRIDVPS